jgi:tetratricopeptide (TPR) repeat protein
MGDTEAASTLYREYMELGNPTERERAQIDRSIEELAALHARRQEALKAAPPDASLLGQEARARFELGVTAYRARRYDAAHAAFLAAKSSVALPELDYNLALTCERLGGLRDAIDHYRAYAASLRKQETSPEAGAELKRVREAIRVHEATLSQQTGSSSQALRDPPPRPPAAKRPRPKNALPPR